MKCNDMKCKLNECIQHKIDVSIYLFFCWFYYFKVTRIRETMSLKLKMLWGGDPHTPHFSLEILPIFEVSRLASMPHPD